MILLLRWIKGNYGKAILQEIQTGLLVKILKRKKKEKISYSFAEMFSISKQL